VLAAAHVAENLQGILEQFSAYAKNNEPIPDPVLALCAAIGWPSLVHLRKAILVVSKMIQVIVYPSADKRAAVDEHLQRFFVQEMAMDATEAFLQRALEVLLERVGLQAGELPGIFRWWQRTLHDVAAFVAEQQALEQQQQQQQPRRYPGTAATAPAAAVAPTAAAAGPLAAAAGDQEAGSGSEDCEASSVFSVLRMRGGGDGSCMGSEAEASDSDSADDQHDEDAGDPHQTYEPSGFHNGPSGSSSTAAPPAQRAAQMPDTASSSSHRSSEDGSSSSGSGYPHADLEGVVTEAMIEAAAAAGDQPLLWAYFDKLWRPMAEMHDSGGASEAVCQCIRQTYADIDAACQQCADELSVELPAQMCRMALQLGDDLMSPLQPGHSAAAGGMAQDHDAAEAAVDSGSAAESLAGSVYEDTAFQHLRSAAGQQSAAGSGSDGGSDGGSGSGSSRRRARQGHSASLGPTDDLVPYFLDVLDDDATLSHRQDPSKELSVRLSILLDFWHERLDTGHALLQQVVVQLLEQQQQHGDSAGPLPAPRRLWSNARLEAAPEHFRGMPFTAAAAWLELVVNVHSLCDDDSSVARDFN
jgi:hypothetical protein